MIFAVFSGWTIVIFLTLCVLLLCYYFYWKWTILKHIPGVKCVFPLGHLWFIVRHVFSNTSLTTYMLEFMNAMAKVFEKEGMFHMRIWPMKNVVILCKADYAEVILSNRVELQKSSLYETLKILVSNGLLSSNGGERYRHHKRIISPNYQKKMMCKHQVYMSAHSAIMCNKIATNEERGKPFALIDYTIPCTFDIAVHTATGNNVGAQFQKDMKATHCIKRFKDIWNERVVKPWLQNEWTFLNLTKTGNEFREINEYLKHFVDDMMDERRKRIKENMYMAKKLNEEYSDEVERPCVLDLLLKHQLTDSNPLSDKEVFEEIVTIIAAGFETTADTLSWAVFLIGTYPEVQEKIHQELDSVFGEDREREVTYDDVNRLQYLLCALKESLRLYPIFPVIARELKNDLEIGGKVIPKGTELALSINAIHRDPKYYEQPEEFIPERFLPENAKKRSLYSFIPFSEGTRRCIGSTFALRANTTILCYILRRFRIETMEKRDSLRMAWEIHGRPDVPTRIKLFDR